MGPSVVVELRALHRRQQLPKRLITIEGAKGECRISKSLMPLARKAHAALLGGGECPDRGPLKDVLQALAGADDASEADTASQAEEPTEAVEALCDKLATEALSRVQSMLTSAVRTKYAIAKERMVETALQTNHSPMTAPHGSSIPISSIHLSAACLARHSESAADVFTP